MSGGVRFFRARTVAYSSTSAKLCSVVNISPISGWFKANLARPPIIADRSTLASAARSTASLPPALEILQDCFFGYALFLQLTGNFCSEHGKQFALEIHRQGGFAPWEKDACDLAAARYQDRILRAKQRCGAVAKVTHAADSHVVTPVTIIAGGDSGQPKNNESCFRALVHLHRAPG